MKHTATPWEVQPHLTPEYDDDPVGVYKVYPAFPKLTNQYFAKDALDRDLDAIHAENRANAELTKMRTAAAEVTLDPVATGAPG